MHLLGSITAVNGRTSCRELSHDQGGKLASWLGKCRNKLTSTSPVPKSEVGVNKRSAA